MNDEIVIYLTKLKKIYLSIDPKVMGKEIVKLDRLLNELKNPVEISSPKPVSKKQTKNTFMENYQILLKKDYKNLTGIKLNYESFTNSENIVAYIETKPKESVIKEATALDLKLLYSLLTGDEKEIKGKKNDLYEAIYRNIRARRRGEAFMKTV
ncbi:hypothetical protein AWH56_021165 [Anaerobacillus isosaccharinicus]|uniref:Uncharacterized protein n=1 Tax=Anaerobacillus isosaccharinicus TaxID=1532552 RepID=A0A1S2LIL4_9BACI|nr:hypothetical protein [Anaerobacillus isosaccharinicus]MBA5586580.1 hypothetical protein [Anaerobacillus isosaccharinicus]QOY35184.1 hypothetical protein AWH56_021165 [Anaerobacillus isosaccharinicus]